MEAEDERGEDGYLLVRVHVPELNVQKCLQFPRDQLVWDVKQQCLAALPKELKESFNYGLFSPPENGKAGKFLDEERRLGDYPFNGPIGYLELKYKRRVYKMTSIDEKQLKSLHTRTNLRRFLDYVQNGHVDKVTKMCTKGLDPNFHCLESGETPLTMAAATKKPSKTLIALVNGGALLDYRTKDGSTAMHRAVEHRSLEAVKTLLELGASPNYRDAKGLTPLYLTVTVPGVDAGFAECLLHDHATIGAQDMQGWQEVHQACKNSLLQHLEHLLFYGADMNAQNASGNTPLHVCAVNNQESCARQLLFRAADRHALNFANQTPYQVAVIAGNLELAEIIENYRQEDVVPFRGPPSYNPRRRSALGWLHRIPSLSNLTTILPPSPCPSDRSSVPYSSSSSMSEGSAPRGEADTASIVTDKSLGDTSDVISDSSGIGTSNSDTNCSVSMPGTTVVCVEAYTSKEEGHLSIREGDILEVTGATDCGYLEGNLRSCGNKNGLFPVHCVQEVRLRHHNIPPPMVASDVRKQERQETRVLGRRENTKHFNTTPRFKKSFSCVPEPRTVVLHKGRKGFGFVLRGAKATSPLMELTPSDKCPGLQYLDDVDPGGVADMAGLKKGDFLIRINNEDVSSASHERVVDLIRKSGHLVQMTVISLGMEPSIPMSKSAILQGDQEIQTCQYATLPRKIVRPAPLPPRRDPKTTLSVGRARARSLVAGMVEEEDTDELPKSSSAESIHQQGQPRTASIRQRPISGRVTSNELEELFQKQKEDETYRQGSLMSSSRFLQGSPKAKVYASVAEMKRSKSKASKRFVNLFVKGGELRRDFHSTPDLAQEVALSSNGKNHRSQEDIAINGRTSPPLHPPPPPPQPSKSNKKVVSSFRPTTNAKLYASPEDVKQVVYRSKNETRPQLRKSQSLRTGPFKPESNNPYAQPIRTVRSQSMAGLKERLHKTPAGKSDTPLIPDPDYSCTESEAETDEDVKLKTLASRLNAVQLQPVENSGNSNASGSSSGSSSIPPSFSVDEIQKGRSLLKSSKSYPDDFFRKQDEIRLEDGDNSSSGVSSDQEAVGTTSTEYNERLSDIVKNTKDVSKKQGILVKRKTVESFRLPPPPEFQEASENLAIEPLAPPPQFSDNRQVTRVRIVGTMTKEASPKPQAKFKQGRLHSQ